MEADTPGAEFQVFANRFAVEVKGPVQMLPINRCFLHHGLDKRFSKQTMRTSGGCSAGFVFDNGIDTAGGFAEALADKRVGRLVKQIQKRVVEVMDLQVFVGDQNGRVDVIQKQIQKLV